MGKKQNTTQMGVSLIVFATGGRFKELAETLAALSRTGVHFQQKVFSLDGYDSRILELVKDEKFDHILVSYARAGYFGSIQRACALVSQPFFFWLEDDWIIHDLAAAREIVQSLISEPDLAQVRLAQDARLRPRDSNRGISGNHIARSDYLYHCHPHFGRTDLLREFCCDLAFQREAKGHNIEDALTEWTRRRGQVYGVLADGRRHCQHIGKHSSIPPGQRQYHDIWSGAEIALCASQNAEQELRKVKMNSRFRFAHDRHDLRIGPRLAALVRDWIQSLLVFPMILVGWPFSAKARHFIREASLYWFGKA